MKKVKREYNRWAFFLILLIIFFPILIWFIPIYYFQNDLSYVIPILLLGIPLTILFIITVVSRLLFSPLYFDIYDEKMFAKSLLRNRNNELLFTNIEAIKINDKESFMALTLIDKLGFKYEYRYVSRNVINSIKVKWKEKSQ